MSQSSLPGSPSIVLYWLRRSALPPKPPIPSSAVTNVELELRLRPRELRGRRTGLRQPGDLLRDHLLDLLERNAGARRGDHREPARDLAGRPGTPAPPCTAAGRRRALLLSRDERPSARISDARSRSASPGREAGRRRPDHVDAVLRHAVRRLDDLLALERRDPERRPVERRPGGDAAEVFLDEPLRLRRVEVAGDDERQVVRRVVGLEEVVDVLERGGRQVLVAADHGPRVRMARRDRGSRGRACTSGRRACSRGPGAARS